MAGLRLTRGGESRLAGAPYQDLPDYAAYVDAVAARLLAEDTDGLLANDRELARERAKLIVNAELDAEQQKRAAAQAQVTEDYGRRQQDRAQARGVDPETMPYGASASDVRLANRPVDEASAQLEMEQNAADRVAYALRQDLPPFEAQEDLNFLRERGDMNPLAGPGKTDMAMRGAIRERRGQYYEMPDGTRIPVGREPTAAEIRAEREWQDWTNETPGTERQALYNPAGYEQFREGVRNDIRDNARADEATYGTGSDAQLLDAAEAGNRMAADQYKNRQARRQSETRVRNAQRGMFYEDKLMVDAGIVPPKPEPGANIEQLERAAFRGRYARRQNELAARKQARIDQAMMAGGQPTGGPFGTRATTTAINQLGPGWREIALLDRLTQGRVGGPTPLGVQAVGAQNAMRMLNAEALAGQDPSVRGMRELQAAGAEAQLPLPVRADRERDANNGVLPAQSPAGQAVLADIAATTVGGTYATDFEYNRAVERAVSEGIPRPDAEAYFRRHAQGTNSGFWGWLLGRGQGETSSPPEAGSPPAAAPPAPGGRGAWRPVG